MHVLCPFMQLFTGHVFKRTGRECVVVAPRGNMYEIRFRPFLLRVSLAATALPLIANVIGRSRAFHPSALWVVLPEMRTSRDASGRFHARLLDMPNVNSQFDNCSFVGSPALPGYKVDPDEKFRKYPANRSPPLFLDWIQAG